MTGAADPGTIVVGVDGSPASRAALDWATRQAELTGSRLLAVTTWEWPRTFGVPLPLAEGYDPESSAAGILEEAVGEIRRGRPSLDVRTSVVEGPAATVLIEASEHADLLVVGTRGHGELAGLLLGSVSERCVGHAHCPVVVVRH